MSHRFAILAATSLLLAVAPASAHHSGAMYDSDKKVTIDGVVKSFEWTNPHVVIRVMENPQAGKAERTWDVLCTSPGNLTRGGWSKRSFKEGDRVQMVVSPLRNGDPGGSFTSAKLVDSGQEVTETSILSINSTSNLK